MKPNAPNGTFEVQIIKYSNDVSVFLLKILTFEDVMPFIGWPVSPILGWLQGGIDVHEWHVLQYIGIIQTDTCNLPVKLRQTTNPAFNFPVEGKSGGVGAQFLESFCWDKFHQTSDGALSSTVLSDVGRMVIRAPGFLHPFLEESYGRLHMKARADRVRKTLFGEEPSILLSRSLWDASSLARNERGHVYTGIGWWLCCICKCTIHASLSRSEFGLSAERSSNNCKVPDFMWLSGRWGLKAKKTTLSYRKIYENFVDANRHSLEDFWGTDVELFEAVELQQTTYWM